MKNRITPFQKLKNKVHKKYQSFGQVYCKAINDHVPFNNYGWKHLSFDGKGHRRRTSSIVMRLKLVLHAHEVIQQAVVVIKDEIKVQKINGVKLRIRYIELACDINGTTKHVTVVLRKIATGTLHFYSVRRTKDRIKKFLAKQKSP